MTPPNPTAGGEDLVARLKAKLAMAQAAHRRVIAEAAHPTVREMVADDIALLSEAIQHIEQVTGERDEAREALDRLGSMEAFAHARAIKIARDEELIARIDFARATPEQRGVDPSYQKWLARTRADHHARRRASYQRSSDSPT